MAYTNSSLVVYTRISPNRNSPRNQPITKITIHHMAGVCSVEDFGNIVAPTSRQMSANYAIGNDGRIGLFCPESDRSWCSSSSWNDNRAITIEVSNSAYGDASGWPVSDAAYNSLIKLCVDICKRNGIKKLEFTGTQDGSLTFHYMFAATACPGPWIKARALDICNKVNAQLSTPEPSPAPVQPTGYTVNLKGTDAIYDTAGGKKIGTVGKDGTYTIIEDTWVAIETSPFTKSTKYGKLKSGAGWVILETATQPSTSVKVNDLVKINASATYYDGGSIPSWVKDENWYVASLSGSRAVLGLNEKKDRNIQSPINTKFLTVVSSTTVVSYTVSLKSTDLVYPEPGGPTKGVVGATGVFTIVEDKVVNGVTYGKLLSGAGWVITKTPDVKKGDKVKVLNPIVYGTTQKFTTYVSTYYVLEVNGDRVVISSDGKNVTTAIDKKNIQKV